MKKVIKLPVRDLESSVNQKKRVAAYCRITRNLKNRTKFRNANELLKNMILNNSEWEFAGIFFDCESGLRKSKRKRVYENLQTIGIGSN